MIVFSIQDTTSNIGYSIIQLELWFDAGILKFHPCKF